MVELIYLLLPYNTNNNYFQLLDLFDIQLAIVTFDNKKSGEHVVYIFPDNCYFDIIQKDPTLSHNILNNITNESIENKVLVISYYFNTNLDIGWSISSGVS